MRIEDIDTKKDDFTDKELDVLGKVLIVRDEVVANDALYRLVQGRMKKLAKKIKSVSDIRTRLDTFSAEAGQDK